MGSAKRLLPAVAFLSSLALVSAKAVHFPPQAISLGVPCVNPDQSRGTCEAYNECASFSIRAYIRGEIGVCGFMPSGDPAVCCQVAANTGRPPFGAGGGAGGGGGSSSSSNSNNNGQPPQQSPPQSGGSSKDSNGGGGGGGGRNDSGNSNDNLQRPPFGGANPPPTFVIPGISVGFDPELGDLASRIRAQQLQQHQGK